MRQVYYGWYIVAITVVIYTVLVGSVFSAFGVFVLPVSAELGLSRAQMNTALGLVSLGNAVLAPFVGWILDRVTAKAVMIASAVIYGLSVITIGLSHAHWLSALALTIGIPIAYLGGGSLSVTLLIARWFTTQRGRAMMLGGLGISFGSLIGPPAIGLLVDVNGWRKALLIMGAALGALLFALATLVRERPGANDLEAGREIVSAKPVGQAERRILSPKTALRVLRVPQFWTMSLSAAMVLGVFTVIAISLIPLGRSNGMSMLQATALMSIMGGTAIMGALLLAPIADRVERVSLLSGLFLLGVLVNTVLLSGGRYSFLLASAISLGLGSGTATPTFNALLADRFGTASFGTVRGLSMLVISVFGLIELHFGGVLYDSSGDYKATFRACIAISLAGAALMFATHITRPPEEIATARKEEVV